MSHKPSRENTAGGVRLAVTHATNQVTFYEVPPEQGWKVDYASRCLIIGSGVPRMYVPLDDVLYFAVESSDPEEHRCHPKSCWCYGTGWRTELGVPCNLPSAADALAEAGEPE